MGKNLAVKGGESGFWQCWNHTLQWENTSNKKFWLCNSLLNQCLNVPVKGVVGPCRNAPQSLCRVSVWLYQKKICFNLNGQGSLRHFLCLSCRSAVHKGAWLISAKQELFLYQTHSGIALIQLTAYTIFWQSQCGLTKYLPLLLLSRM